MCAQYSYDGDSLFFILGRGEAKGAWNEEEEGVGENERSGGLVATQIKKGH